MFGLSYLKLAGIIGGALAVIAFVLLALHWKNQAADRGEKLATICQATRDASGQPKLKCAEVAKQIGFMGQTITAFSHALDVQSARVAALGAETKRQQGEAAKASQNAQARARGAEATSQRLIASARSTVASRGSQGPCEPSKALEGAWR